MTMITVPAPMVTIDSNLLLPQLPIQEVIRYYDPFILLQHLRGFLSDGVLLSHITDELICDYMINRGFNIET